MGKRNQGSSGNDYRGGQGGKRFRGGTAKDSLTGPAIWATCLRNKEKKAADELIAYLEEIADRLYPDVNFEDYQAQAPSPPPSVPVYENSEDEMDAMMNGGAPSTSKVEELPPAPTKEPEPAQSKSKDAELDIESQIQAELAELQGGRKKTGGGVGGKGKQPEQAKPKAKRFRSLDTDTECLLFIACSAPYDPYVLVQSLLEEVEKTGQSRSRFTMRLTPSSESCKANDVDISDMAGRILLPFFKASEEKGKGTEEKTDVSSSEKKPLGVDVVTKQLKGGPLSFKIDVRKRSSVFQRDRLLSIIGEAIPREGGHHADLKNAGQDGVMIVVMILRNVCSISVNAGYDRFRKFNLLETAEAGRKDEEGGRVAAAQEAKDEEKVEKEA